MHVGCMKISRPLPDQICQICISHEKVSLWSLEDLGLTTARLFPTGVTVGMGVASVFSPVKQDFKKKKNPYKADPKVEQILCKCLGVQLEYCGQSAKSCYLHFQKCNRFRCTLPRRGQVTQCMQGVGSAARGSRNTSCLLAVLLLINTSTQRQGEEDLSFCQHD